MLGSECCCFVERDASPGLELHRDRSDDRSAVELSPVHWRNDLKQGCLGMLLLGELQPVLDSLASFG